MAVQFPPKIATDGHQVQSLEGSVGPEEQITEAEDGIDQPLARGTNPADPAGMKLSTQSDSKVPRQLLVDLGVLALESGKPIGELSDAAVAEAVRVLQKTLSVPVSGSFDVATQQAVKSYITAVQESLTRLDLYEGRANGLFQDATRESVRGFQREAGLEATGCLTPETYVKIEEQVQAKYGG